MNGRRRYLRPLALFVLMALFSLSLVGQLDSRLNIGGFDWDTSIDYQSYDQSRNALGNWTHNSQNNLKESETPALYNEANSGLIGEAIGDADDGIQADEQKSESTFADTQEVLSQPAQQEVASHEPAAHEQDIKAVKVAVNEIPQAPLPNPEVEREKPTVLIHTVRAGETLWDIAKSYGITVNQIVTANNIKNQNRIQVGQNLKILTVKGVLHKVAVGENLWEIADRYGVSLAEIVDVNKITNPSMIQVGHEIVIPGATQLLIKDALVVNGQLQKAFDWPVRGRISSNFGMRWGRMHNGMDIAVVTGTPVKAAADGRVTFSGSNGGYGIMVIIDHGNGVETRYAHNSRNVVSVGQQVRRGDTIAYSGNTGNSTGPHLHFEIRYRSTPVDPRKYLKD